MRNEGRRVHILLNAAKRYFKDFDSIPEEEVEIWNWNDRDNEMEDNLMIAVADWKRIRFYFTFNNISRGSIEPWDTMETKTAKVFIQKEVR